jgi:hypothetical protein
VSRRWLAAACLAALCVACGKQEPAPVTTEPAESAPGVEATLYFPGPGGLLYPEPREMPAAASLEERIRALAEAVLAGPTGDVGVAPFDSEVRVSTVFRAHDGTVYLGLEAPEGAPPPAIGSTAEMQIVYALVNSVTLNAPQVERVALLWNGVQRTSFAGHVDTARPLGPRREMIAATEPGDSAPPP